MKTSEEGEIKYMILMFKNIQKNWKINMWREGKNAVFRRDLSKVCATGI